MKINRRKLAPGIGVAAMVGVAFRMRALASWRPQTLARVNFKPTRILFSRDKKRLIVADMSRNSGDRAIFNWRTGAFDVGKEGLAEFDADLYDFQICPRVWADSGAMQLIFSPAPGRDVRLQDGVKNESDLLALDSGKSHSGWSKARREVFLERGGAIWIWDWNSGQLKKRVRYAKNGARQAVFSPDGKWLIVCQVEKSGYYLRRYEVQSGKREETISQNLGFPEFGFSPDGQFFWFVQGFRTQPEDFNLSRADNYQWLGGSECAGPVKWVSKSRAGIVAEKNFIWHDGVDEAGNNRPTYLRGPFKGISDWALSPDGRWIYSCEPSGIIRRWRAR